MSHNAKSYRKKITDATGAKCAKIDLLFKQHSLKKETTSPGPDMHDTMKGSPAPVAAETVATASAADINDQDSESDDQTRPSSHSVLVPDQRKFASTKYEEQYDWLYYSAARTGYCCKYCEYFHRNSKESDIPYVGRGVQLGTHPSRKLEKHDQSENHKKAASKYFYTDGKKDSSHSVISMLNKQASLQNQSAAALEKLNNSKYIKIVFKTAFFMLRKQWALSENLDDFIVNFLQKDLELEPVVEHITRHPNIKYTSPSSSVEVIQSLAFAFEDDALKTLREATCYTLMTDESTDEGNRNQFAIIVRYLRDGRIQDVYLGMVHIQSATAENLMNVIENFLLAKGIPIKKAIMVGFDGCNTMSGENKGLQRRFRHVVPYQLYIHCRNHRLALCVKHLVKAYPILAELDELLIGIWKMFTYSPQKYAAFESVQTAYNLTKLSFIKAASTRWLSHGRACQRLLDRFEAIMDTLDAIYNEKHQPEVLGVRQMLADKNMAATAAVLCDILAPVIPFSDYLQGDVHFSHVNDRVKELVDQLHGLVERFRAVGNGIVEVGLQFSKVETLWEVIDDRTDLARRLRGPPAVSVHQFAEEIAVPMTYSLISELEDAFHCSEVLKSFAVFNMKKVPETVAEVVADYGKTEIAHLASHYGKMKEDTLFGHRTVEYPVFPEVQILQEFEGFKHQMFTINSEKFPHL